MPQTPYKITPYYHKERAAGATFGDRNGWQMPLHYGDAVAEHHAVRQAAGLFDVHTQGELIIQGKDALLAVQRLYVNNLDVPVGRAVYTQMCNEQGGIMDDTITYRLGERTFMVVTGSVNREKSYNYIRKTLAEWDICATVTDVTSGTAYLELHGPKSRDILRKLTDVDVSNEKLPYMWGTFGKLAGVDAFIARSGFTGELGYEFYFPTEYGEYLWDAIMEAGQPFGLKPVGLICLGTVSLEKAYLIYGRDINETITPLEAGLGWCVKFDKPVDFVGKAALLKQKAEGIKRKLMGFQVDDGKTIADVGVPVSINGQVVGETTRAGYGPTIQKSVGLAFLPPTTAIGTKIVIHNKAGEITATVVERPFYDPKGKLLRV